MSDRSACRSCKAPIRWAETDAGKAIPIDPEPVPTGNLVMTHVTVGGPVRVRYVRVRYVRKGEQLSPEAPRYVTHFVSCPERDQWRKPKEKESSSGTR